MPFAGSERVTTGSSVLPVPRLLQASTAPDVVPVDLGRQLFQRRFHESVLSAQANGLAAVAFTPLGLIPDEIVRGGISVAPIDLVNRRRSDVLIPDENRPHNVVFAGGDPIKAFLLVLQRGNNR